MRGKLQLNDTNFEVEVTPKGRTVSVQVDGKDFVVELESSEEGYCARIAGHAIHIELDGQQRKQLSVSQHVDIQVDGYPFTTQFQLQRAHTAGQASLDIGSGSQDEGSVLSLMPGTIFKLCVEEGQYVEAGELLLILEAMKMENEIKAPIAGLVESIPVAEGTSVAKGELLVQLAAPNEDTDTDA